MEIIYSNDAKKYLARQGKKTAIRIRDAIARYPSIQKHLQMYSR